MVEKGKENEGVEMSREGKIEIMGHGRLVSADLVCQLLCTCPFCKHAFDAFGTDFFRNHGLDILQDDLAWSIVVDSDEVQLPVVCPACCDEFTVRHGSVATINQWND